MNYSYDKYLAPYGTTPEYEISKEIITRLRSIGKTEINLTNVLILTYLVYKEDRTNYDCFGSILKDNWKKNEFGLPCFDNIVKNFKAENLGTKEPNVYFAFLDKQNELLDKIIIEYGTLKTSELFGIIELDRALKETNVNDYIPPDKLKEEPKTSYLKRFILKAQNQNSRK